MMVKIFTKDKCGKISFTEEELKALLDEVYIEGYRANHIYTYQPPVYPYWCTTTSNKNTVDTDKVKIEIGE